MAPTTEVLVAWLRADGRLADVEPTSDDAAALNKRDLAAAATGWVAVEGVRGQVEVRIARDFPSQLPVVAVGLAGPFAGAPHVGATGVICYRQEERVTADPGRPADIVSEAVALAVDTLRKGRAAAHLEYADEITAYWLHSFARSPTYMSLVEPLDEPRLVKSARDRRGARIFLESHDQLATYSPRRRQDGEVRNALYVPVDLPSRPGFHPKELATPAGFTEVVLPILSRDPPSWRTFLGDVRSTSVDVLLGVKRARGRRGVVGVSIETRQTLDKSILTRLDRCKFSAFLVEPGDRAYLLPRGGGSASLSGKKVLLVGCGAVGGHIALGLARAGIGRLDLVDPDTFETANTFRHVCGRARWPLGKALGLRQEIERLLPYVEVHHQPSDILKLLRLEPTLLAGYDLIISATGAPLVDRRINDALLATPGAPAALFTWLEPYDLGGHVLAVNVAGRRHGCFECLYAYDEDEEQYLCRAAFAAPGVEYGQDALGCGGQFVPFGDLQANRLALRVVERALDLLQGADDGGLISCKGKGREFLDAGFRATRWYDEPGPELSLSSSQLARSDCPVCSP